MYNVVLFLKKDGLLNNNYKYGMINEIAPIKDGIILKAVVHYRNNQEKVDRYTTRAV